MVSFSQKDFSNKSSRQTDKKVQELYTECMCCSEGAQAHSSAYFGQGTGDIVRDDVDCNGAESQLIDCAASTTHNCGHSEDASVTCASKTFYY